MTGSAEKSASSKRAPRSGVGQLALILALAVAVGAGGAGLHLMLDVAPETAGLAVLSCLSALVAIYTVMQRTSTVAALDAQIEELKAELAHYKAPYSRRGSAPAELTATTGVGSPVADAAKAEASSSAPRAPSASPSATDLSRAEAEPKAAASGTASPASSAATPPPASSTGSPSTPPPEGRSDGAGPLPLLPARPATGGAPSPKPPGGPLVDAPTIMPPPLAARSGPPAPPSPRAGRPGEAGPASTTRLDLDTMQSLIDQLASKLDQPLIGESAPGALSEAAAIMKSAARPASSRAPARSAATPVGHLALVAEAVEANRMDVYLDPILGLEDRKARHFELSVKLRTGTGEELDGDDVVAMASGTGLLARIDAAKLARAAEVAERLRSRGLRASLFSNLAGESLSDDNFLGAFADLFDAEEGLGTKLVLSFSQADARTFTTAHWQAIGSMAAIGLSFALEHVTDLDMDFSNLRKSGFAFVKLDASVFLEGLPAAGGRIPAADVCRYFSSLGLGLVIDGIVAEKDLARIMGFGVLLGQGALFGAPRSVEIDRVKRAA